MVVVYVIMAIVIGLMIGIDVVLWSETLVPQAWAVLQADWPEILVATVVLFAALMIFVWPVARRGEERW